MGTTRETFEKLHPRQAAQPCLGSSAAAIAPSEPEALSGRLCRRAVVVSALLLIALLGGPAGRAASTTALKFDLLEHHMIVVRGAIGRIEGLKLLIDTGSIPSVVDRKVARKLAVKVLESEFVAFGKKTRVMSTTLPAIRIGPIFADGVRAGVADLAFLHGVDAIIGLDVLWRSSFSIDYEQQQLTFGPVVERDRSVQLDVNPPFLTVRLELDGRPVRLLVDTGSSRLVLFQRRVRDKLLSLPAHGDLMMHHLAGATKLHRVFLPAMAVGGATLERVEAFMSDEPVDGYPAEIDGVLGLRVLAPNHADFDFERRKLDFN